MSTVSKENLKTVGKVNFSAENFTASENTAIIYAKGNKFAHNAANEIYGYYKEQGITVMKPSDMPCDKAYNAIYVGTRQVGDDGKWSILVDGNDLYFTSADGGYAMLAQYYTLLPYTEGKAWTTTATPAEFFNNEDENFGCTKTIDGVTYTYVWGDEFNGDVIDDRKWIYSVGASRICPLPGQVLSAGSDTFKMEKDENGSFMRMTVYKDDQDRYIVPTSIQTTEKMAYKYGYAEVSVKIPKGYGAFPAFWLMSDQEKSVHDYYYKTAPLGTDGDNKIFHSEIDVFEYFPIAGRDLEGQNSIDATHHLWWKEKEGKAEHGSLHGHYKSGDVDGLGEKYTVIGFRWTENATTMYVNGVQYAHFEFDTQKWNADKGGSYLLEEVMPKGYNPALKDPHVFVFTNHLCNPGQEYVTHSIVPDDFKFYDLDVEYIRLYQTEGCELYTINEQKNELSVAIK